MDKIYSSFSLPEELCDNINITPQLNELLNIEILYHIQLYKNQIKNRKYYQTNMVNIQHINTSFDFIDSYKMIHILKYIWFLEDGEIDFFNYKLNVPKGNLLIFPNSWCLPYKINAKCIYS